jgi:nucleoside-diphosphate-sugar epimerase
VLVTGGAGYIGSVLVRELLKSGWRVRVLDNFVYGRGPLRELLDHPDFELVVGDCRNSADVEKAIDGAQSLVHLAAIVGDPVCKQYPKAALETYYLATRALAETAARRDLRRFVFASSCSVYGSSDTEVDEDTTARPLSLYARTKIDSELALLRMRSDSFHPVILRFASVFGLSARPRFDLVVNLLTARACKDGVITVYNPGQWRPFIHVRDIARAVCRVLEAPTATVDGEVFNVGDQRLNCTLGGLGDKISSVVGNVRVEHVSNSDPRDYRASFDKIRSRLGFECRHLVEDGIVECMNAVQTRAILDYADPRYSNERSLQMTKNLGHETRFDD